MVNLGEYSSHIPRWENSDSLKKKSTSNNPTRLWKVATNQPGYGNFQQTNQAMEGCGLWSSCGAFPALVVNGTFAGVFGEGGCSCFFLANKNFTQPSRKTLKNFWALDIWVEKTSLNFYFMVLEWVRTGNFRKTKSGTVWQEQNKLLWDGPPFLRLMYLTPILTCFSLVLTGGWEEGVLKGQNVGNKIHCFLCSIRSISPSPHPSGKVIFSTHTHT